MLGDPLFLFVWHTHFQQESPAEAKQRRVPENNQPGLSPSTKGILQGNQNFQSLKKTYVTTNPTSFAGKPFKKRIRYDQTTSRATQQMILDIRSKALQGLLKGSWDLVSRL